MPDLDAIRGRFPALSRTHEGRPVAWLDGPGGTQVPSSVISAIGGTLERGVSNLSDHFPPGREALEAMAAARSAIADLLGAESPEQIVFGPNMTTLTFSVSRAISRTWRSGDRVVVTRLDHDANVNPWLLAARDVGAEVDWVDITPDSELDLDSLDSVLSERTRLVAVTAASNATGTVVDVAEVVRRAHRVGALVYVDAVHHTPHRRLDVAAAEVDFIVCSAYKFFGPHIGALYGRAELLARLPAYKVRPAPDDPPWRWETGTQNFPALRGVAAAVNYLADLSDLGTQVPRNERLAAAYRWIENHERELASRFLEGLSDLPRLRLVGKNHTEGRVPTFCVTIEGVDPQRAVRELARSGIYAWAGHYYAWEPMRALGLLDEGGAVRVGFVHYNTIDEVDRVLEALSLLT